MQKNLLSCPSDNPLTAPSAPEGCPQSQRSEVGGVQVAKAQMLLAAVRDELISQSATAHLGHTSQFVAETTIW